MYLSHYLSRSGVCSRRKAADLIKEGRVSVNGEAVTDPSYLVQDSDKVLCDDKKVFLEKPMYIALNKPKGIVTTCDDERGRDTVLDLVRMKKKVRLYPIGRLDKETTGIILLTNDGEFAQKLAHPRYNISKTYIAKINKPMLHGAYERLKRGIFLKDGKFKPDRVFYPKNTTKRIVGLTIHSGRYRVIRRALFQMGFEVDALDRVSVGSISIKGLPLGSWRELKEKEVAELMQISLSTPAQKQSRSAKKPSRPSSKKNKR